MDRHAAAPTSPATPETTQPCWCVNPLSPLLVLAGDSQQEYTDLRVAANATGSREEIEQAGESGSNHIMGSSKQEARQQQCGGFVYSAGRCGSWEAPPSKVGKGTGLAQRPASTPHCPPPPCCCCCSSLPGTSVGRP